MGRHSACAGFSLIELLVSILLGMIVVGGAATLYVVSKRSFNETEQVANLADNARFSLTLLENSLRHVGFFGPADPDEIILDADLGTVAGDCSGNAAAYSFDWHFFGLAATDATPLDCIDDALANTDVLVIKHLAPAPRYDADPADPSAVRDGVISFPGALSGTDTYAILTSETGLLFDGADSGPPVGAGDLYANGTAFPYRFSIFYVRDTGGVPALSRKILQWDLVEGVQNMQFLYGVDEDADGEPDRYVNESSIATAEQWRRVLVVRAFLLLQSVAEDVGYVDDRSYQLGDTAVPAANDNRRRLLVRTQTVLRNQRLRNRGGA